MIQYCCWLPPFYCCWLPPFHCCWLPPFSTAASLLLEAADLLLPLLRTLWRQATSAASWVLVRLVGQAVALVRRGVQQGSGQAAAAGAAAGAGAQGMAGAHGEQPLQQRRRRARQRRQAGQESGAEQQGGGSRPSWAWEG